MKTAPKILHLLIIIAVFVSIPALAQKQPPREDPKLKKITELIQAGNFDQAIKQLDQMIRVNPKNLTAVFFRGLAKFIKHDYKGALVDYNKIILLVPKATGLEQVYNNRGVIYESYGEDAKALADYNKAIALNARIAEPYNGRANILLKKGDLEKALLDYNKALELDSQMMPAYDGRAAIYLIKGELDKSLDDLDKALALAPNSPTTILQRGMILGLKGYWFAAADNLKAAIELNANASSPYVRSLSASLADLDKHLAANPKSGKALAVRGLIKMFQNREPEAVEDFKKAFALEPALKTELDALIEPVKTKMGN